MASAFVSGYSLRLGRKDERYLLLRFMQRTYAELYPGYDYQHLQDVIDQYWSEQTPFWWVTSPTNHQQFVAGLWLGTAIDQLSGEAYTHLFMLFVDPNYRRQGLGTALLQVAEDWAAQQGDDQIGLQVFTIAQPALALYEKLGYRPRALLLMKEIDQQ
ncbi:GNAT family N-acetyltransferase [Acaryochloris sp. IP29b_bin.148]|uniref:GNAT family N-acetyltransferase n=1 Tax=Acaryochloris sp. IP29b_bin.148 TaxID=2969218 RepID=UPI0026088AFA|nr:GNAT family N-acetyltransferase [Acaryochloris sp. IP29b_bin.148]